MSNTIKRFTTIDGKELSITSFVGKDADASIQFTIQNGSITYFQLNSNQLKELIEVIQKRLDREPGYSATDSHPQEDL